RYRTADQFAEALEDSFAEVLPLESRRSPYPAAPSSSRPGAPPRPSEPSVFRASAAPPSFLASRDHAEHSLALLASGCGARSRRGRHDSSAPGGAVRGSAAAGGCMKPPVSQRLSSPTPPEVDSLRSVDPDARSPSLGVDLSAAESIERTAHDAL